MGELAGFRFQGVGSPDPVGLLNWRRFGRAPRRAGGGEPGGDCPEGGADASAVIATLLPVDDLAATELMREFYRLRYSVGRDKAEALRRAQFQ
ncbi:MAG: CHAT domain-containing protein [Deltaproteobacteria bacterium]|nr:CHAT domain-containing protein [Deltaproteobacteria bacterium]